MNETNPKRLNLAALLEEDASEPVPPSLRPEDVEELDNPVPKRSRNCLFCKVNPKRTPSSDYCQACYEKREADRAAKRASNGRDASGVPISNERRLAELRNGVRRKQGLKPLTPEEVEEIDHIKKSGGAGFEPPTFDDVFAEHAKNLNPDPLPAPTDIALTAQGEGLDFDERILYGKLGEMAKALLPLPLGYTFVCLLARAAALGIEEAEGWVRPNHYVGLLGPVGWGKTACMDMARRAIFLPDDAVSVITPSSDRGLINMLQREGKPFLLVEDEFTAVLNKCAIQNSALPSLLNKLWNNDKGGAQDKKPGASEAHAVLSILGNVKCDGPSEFAALFGVKTVSGLSDRFIFGYSKDYVDFQPRNISAAVIEPKPVKIPAWVWDAKSKWAEGNPSKRRMTEIVLREALVAAAVNGDTEITKAGFEAALRFGEWQLRVRDQYRAGLSMNQGAEALGAVYTAIEGRGAEQARTKKSDKEIKLDERYEYLPAAVPVDKKDLHLLVNVREACNKANLYRRYGKLVKEAKTLLETEGFIVRVGVEGRKKPTPFVRLQRRMQ